MAAASAPVEEPREDVLEITRVFDAPRELVWRAWTEPELVKRWWGPEYFTCPFARIDLRVGGKYLFCMRSSDGKDYWSTGVYREIVPPERIVCTDSFADEKGNVVPASYYGMVAPYPLELLLRVSFEARAGKTESTLRHTDFPPGSERDNARDGWSTSLDKLAGLLAELQAKPGTGSSKG
jgi:uncharacterized protein YndB with AHSA1/START domain